MIQAVEQVQSYSCMLGSRKREMGLRLVAQQHEPAHSFHLPDANSFHAQTEVPKRTCKRPTGNHELHHGYIEGRKSDL